MTIIDFKQKLAAAHERTFQLEHAVSREFFDQGVDLDTLFLELSYAAEDRGAEVSVGTVDELKDVLSTDPYLPHGSLTLVGPSISLSWRGKTRKFCLGVDPDCDLEGGDGKRLRLLSWSGLWPDCSFDEDHGVASIEEFFDALVAEIAAIQQEAQTAVRLDEERARLSKAAQPTPRTTSFWDRVAAVGVLAGIFMSIHAAEERTLVAGLAIAGIILLWTGLLNLKWQSEAANPMWSKGLWRVSIGAALFALPAISAMLSTDINISAPLDCTIAACPGF